MAVQHIEADRVISVEITEVSEHAGRDRYGYGNKIPTRYKLKCSDKRTRRVYAIVQGNSGSSYVLVKGEMLFLSPGVRMMIDAIRKV